MAEEYNKELCEERHKDINKALDSLVATQKDIFKKIDLQSLLMSALVITATIFNFFR